MEDRMDALVKAIQEHSGLSLREIMEAGEHGADAGWSGFTYTVDGAAFTVQNRELVWSLLADDAEQAGFENVAAFVGGFTRSDMSDTQDGFDCLISWWALETAGRYLSDTADERHEAESDRMRDLGEEYGRNAAGWLLDGNSPDEAAVRLLVGLLEGDPVSAERRH